MLEEKGTQIQATMFNEAARKFYEKFQLGKVLAYQSFDCFELWILKKQQDEEMLVPHSDIVLRISKWRSLHQ
ncbi:hypothetical protein V6N11_011537 [Hibiscus sabdariffa]|uniref:Uncharacterized protein n=1 Tax=Hibiscus sabdariffa TaxID=183260 RepID=A0ABR2S8I1_9ROSI